MTDAIRDRVATFHVSLPLGHPAIREITKDWTKEEYSAAMDDVLRYGNVCVVDGQYVSWDTGKRLRHAKATPPPEPAPWRDPVIVEGGWPWRRNR